jgi:hypothetical protein
VNDYAIVVLTGFPDIFAQFYYSAVKFEAKTKRVFVTSRTLSEVESSLRWDSVTCIAGVEPFSFPRNANIGIKAAGRSDVFLVNDDVQFLKPNSVAALASIAYEHPEVGILSPVFEGRVGNRLQERSGSGQGKFIHEFSYSDQRLCFTGVYIRRAVFDAVGLLDERFDGYGRDDDDFCKRVQDMGLKLGVTPEVVMRHGFGADEHSASFKRAKRYPPSGMDPAMNLKWRDKWGLK